jgi:hypothetical protein
VLKRSNSRPDELIDGSQLELTAALAFRFGFALGHERLFFGRQLAFAVQQRERLLQLALLALRK